MKLICKSVYLFIIAVMADIYKKIFDAKIDRCIKRCGDISSQRLTRMSDRSYKLYLKFVSLENEFKHFTVIKYKA